MAGRSGSTFGKRQKEQKRQEKRLEKAARKDQRKIEKQSGVPSNDDELQPLDGPTDYFDSELDSETHPRSS